MIKRTIPFLFVAALAFPGSAAAQKLEVNGPLAVQGHGPLRGELSMSDPSETRALLFAGRGGFVRFVDLAGDLQVKCQGRGRSNEKTNDQGHRVFTCAGRGGRAKVHGSKFRIAAFLARYRALIPEGTIGTLQGRFKTGGRRERPSDHADRLEDKGKGPLPPQQEPPAEEDEDVPTVEEVAEILEQAEGDG